MFPIFIELTLSDDDKVTVNANHISSMHYDGHTTITIYNRPSGILVRETPEEIEILTRHKYLMLKN